MEIQFTIVQNSVSFNGVTSVFDYITAYHDGKKVCIGVTDAEKPKDALTFMTTYRKGLEVRADQEFNIPAEIHAYENQFD